MKFRLRGRQKFGPVYVNYGLHGITSWGFKVGPFSYNVTRRTSTIDTPGPGSLHHQHGRRSK